MINSSNHNETLELIIKDPSLASLSTEYSELVLDGIMDDGALKDIPLVGSVVGLINSGNSVNKHLTAKKLYKFLLYAVERCGYVNGIGS